MGDKYGNILLRENKAKLVAELETLNKELKKFADSAKEKLQKEFDRCNVRTISKKSCFRV